MIVLGISETHCATAAVLRDGEIIGCASEERFSRLKNDAGYPRRAIDALLRDLGSPRPRSTSWPSRGCGRAAREWMNRVLHDEAYRREYYGVRLAGPREAVARRGRKLGASWALVRRARGKFGISPGRAPRVRSRSIWGRVPSESSASIITPVTRRPPISAHLRGQSRHSCSPTTTRATASAPPRRSRRGSSLVRHEATPAAPGSLGSFYSW